MTGAFWDDHFDAILAVPASAMVAGLTWVLTRRGKAAETDSSIATGANAAVAVMLTAMEELRSQVADLTTQVEALEAANEVKDQIITDLRAEVADLRTCVNKETHVH